MSKTTRPSLLTVASALAGTLTTLVPDVAHAEGTLGEPNQVILGAERLFGLSFWSLKTDNNGATNTTSGTTLSLLTSSNSIASIIPYLTPRLAADFSLNAFTIGGSIGYSSTAVKTDPGNGQPTRESDTVTSFVFTPARRVRLANRRAGSTSGRARASPTSTCPPAIRAPFRGWG